MPSIDHRYSIEILRCVQDVLRCSQMVPAFWWSPAIQWFGSMDFDNPKVYSDTSIFDGLDKYWIGEADDSLKTRNLYHVIYEQALSTFNKISLFAGPCFSSYSNHPTTLQSRCTTGVTTASRSVASITCWFVRSQWGCFFCNISHQQVLSSTPPFCNSCRQSILAFLRLGILVLGSLGICFVQIKTQTQNRFCTKETKNKNNSLIDLSPLLYLNQMIHFFSRKLLQRGRTGVEEKKLSCICAGTQPHKQKTGFEEKQLTCICAGILIEHRSIL